MSQQELFHYTPSHLAPEWQKAKPAKPCDQLIKTKNGKVVERFVVEQAWPGEGPNGADVYAAVSLADGRTAMLSSTDSIVISRNRRNYTAEDWAVISIHG